MGMGMGMGMGDGRWEVVVVDVHHPFAHCDPMMVFWGFGQFDIHCARSNYSKFGSNSSLDDDVWVVGLEKGSGYGDGDGDGDVGWEIGDGGWEVVCVDVHHPFDHCHPMIVFRGFGQFNIHVARLDYR